MTELQVILSAYIACGMAYVWAEHRTYEYDYEKMPKLYLSLNIAQQLVHYTRVALTYPLYIVEDMIIYMMNKYFEEVEKEETKKPDTCPDCGHEIWQGKGVFPIMPCYCLKDDSPPICSKCKHGVHWPGTCEFIQIYARGPGDPPGNQRCLCGYEISYESTYSHETPEDDE